ncbi:MAG: class I SAM-dependent methyltransferase [Acholeplasmatales bacterium]|nr:MAG: class I SAM-dependent methyltransferase [Acholeplasmatales bacterium]
MSHYYDADQDNVKSAPRRISFELEGQHYTLMTDHGVFSHGHVDEATRLLIETVRLDAGQKALDLGCGYGVIGIVLAKRDQAQVTLTDVNTRALMLADENAKANHVSVHCIASDGFTEIDNQFDAIITNPPIRIGKTEL